MISSCEIMKYGHNTMTRRQSKSQGKRLTGSREGEALTCTGKVPGTRRREAEGESYPQAQGAHTVQGVNPKLPK